MTGNLEAGLQTARFTIYSILHHNVATQFGTATAFVSRGMPSTKLWQTIDVVLNYLAKYIVRWT